MKHHPTPAQILAARNAAGLTQTRAGDLVHSSCRTWQQWEAGDRNMHPGLWELFGMKVAQKQGRNRATAGHQGK